MKKDREILKFSEEEARRIAYEDHSDFKLIEEELEDERRWVNCYSIIVERISDGKFFQSYYEKGKTESQDQSPYEYDDPIFRQVFKVKKEIIAYE